MDPDAAAAARAAEQHGMLTRTDARAAGLTPRQIRHRVRTGRWTEVRPGIYLLGGVGFGPMQRLLGATWATRGCASHLSAAWLHGLVERPPLRPEVTSARTESAHRAGIRLHRTDDLEAVDVVRCRGVVVTGVARTCIDLGDRMTADQLERVVDRALHRGLTQVDPLVERFWGLARRGRPGIATARQVLTRLDPAIPPTESDLETMLCEVLRRRGLPMPVRQHEVVVGGRRVRLDLAYPELRVAIEGDGFAFHGSRLAFEADRERQNALVVAGWVVLRFTWRQICNRPDWVADQVATTLAQAGR
jgi:very-short-patch-repair endonuclease